MLQRIVLAHHFVAPPGWVCEEYAAARLHHGVVYALSRQAEYRMHGSGSLTLRPGECLYVPRGTVYVTQSVGHEDFEHMTVNFDIAGEERLFAAPVKCRFHNATRFEQVFSALVRHWSVRHPHYRERCLGLL